MDAKAAFKAYCNTYRNSIYSAVSIDSEYRNAAHDAEMDRCERYVICAGKRKSI